MNIQIRLSSISFHVLTFYLHINFYLFHSHFLALGQTWWLTRGRYGLFPGSFYFRKFGNFLRLYFESKLQQDIVLSEFTLWHWSKYRVPRQGMEVFNTCIGNTNIVSTQCCRGKTDKPDNQVLESKTLKQIYNKPKLPQVVWKIS